MTDLVTAEQTSIVDQHHTSQSTRGLATIGESIAAVIANPKDLAAIDTDKLNALYDIAEKIRKEELRLAYEDAFAAAKSQMRPVQKRGHNPSTRSSYPKLEDVQAMADPILTANGLTYGYTMRDCPVADHVRFVMQVKHRLGHVAEAVLDAPLDYVGPKGQPVKTRLQGMGSSMTYCKRRMLIDFFSIRTQDGEVDDDGHAAGMGPASQLITARQTAYLQKLAEFTNINMDRVYGVYGVKSLDQLTQTLFVPARQVMMDKIGMTQKERAEWEESAGVKGHDRP